jgi:hypothetical protein
MAVKAKESGERDDMPRSSRVKHQVFTIAGLFALVLATVFAVTPAGRWVLRSETAAPVDIPVVSEYTCDLSDYGYTGPPVDMTATTSVLALATAVAQPGFSGVFSASGPESFSTSAATLPASVASRLTNLSEISLEATIPVTGAPAAAPVAKIWAATKDAFLPTGPLTQLQMLDAVDTAFFSSPGIAVLHPPAESLQFTPYRAGKPLPAINCAVVKAPVPPTTITVIAAPANAPTNAPASAPASAPTNVPPSAPANSPVYGCTSNYRTTSYRSPLPMTITTSGVPRVGHLLTVTLSSPATGLADPAYGLTTQLALTGALPVTGAQAGEVKLKVTTPYTDLPTFGVSGRFRLKKAGTETIFFPRHFVYTVYLQSGTKAVFTCSLATSPAPVGLTVRVAR